MAIENTGRKNVDVEEVKKEANFDSKSNLFTQQDQGKIRTSDEQSTWIPDDAKKSYHDQRLSQSKWSFRLSFWGSIIGFAVLIWSINRGIQVGNPEWAGIVSGIIIESVSALFYTQSNSANEKITKFFAELTQDANRKDAIKLVDKINNTDIRDGVLTKLSLHLVGIDEERICKNTKEICKKHEE